MTGQQLGRGLKLLLVGHGDIWLRVLMNLGEAGFLFRIRLMGLRLLFPNIGQVVEMLSRFGSLCFCRRARLSPISQSRLFRDEVNRSCHSESPRLLEFS